MSDEQFVITLFALVSAVGMVLAVIMGPIGRAFGRRLEGRTVGDADVQALRDDLQGHQADLSHLQREMAELQERVDFAERLLASNTDNAGLPAGQSRQAH